MSQATGQRPAAVMAAPARWPDVVSVPPDGGRATIAKFLLRHIAGRLPFRVAPAGARPFGHGGSDSPVLVLHRPADFYRRVGARGLIGLGESYMAGDWDSDDLPGLLTVMASQMDRLVPPALQWLRKVYVRRPPATDDASVERARNNISRHYDLSNDLFALFLDESMTYSSALFGCDGAGAPVASAAVLAEAQRRKIDRLLDLAGVGPGSRVLELGTGWGELAIRAAGRGATVLTVTLSEEQKVLAEQRIAAAGLSGRVTVQLTDYRRVEGQYDAILSVEMIEAVGERYWPAYFTALDRLLAPGGKIGLQSIIMDHRRMMATRHTLTWILKYVFPGGLIPSVTAIKQNLAAHTSLHVADQLDFGAHYAETLRVWRETFLAGAARLPELGFDETFQRMWLLYLVYSEAGFRSGYIDVSQFLITRDEGSPAVTRPAVAAKPVPAGGAAGLLLPLIEQLFRGELPLRVRAWDGSEAGPAGAPVLVLRSRQALRRIMWHPGELGIAQAYVTGELDVEGDLTEGLRSVWRAARASAPATGGRAAGRDAGPLGAGPLTAGSLAARPLAAGRRAAGRLKKAVPLPPELWGDAVRAAVTLGIPGPRPKAPASEARISGRLHSKSRDQAVIAHHYDVPPAFYQLILDPQMAYSSGYWTSAGPGYTLQDAQRDKLDQICRKLALEPGMRLLDIGCGWGSLTVHAARQYGARVTAVTLSREQAGHVRRRAADAGLGDLVEVRNQDYRDIAAGQYDAVASVEMGEHVGAGQYPVFCALIRRQLRPGGRVLIQQMSRSSNAPGGGKFIEAYIAPDMHMRPVGETACLIEDAGLEVRDIEAMREHYPPTIRAWLDNLEQRWDQAVALIGRESARVWRLYLAGGALAFEEGRMGVDQILAARPSASGQSGFSLTARSI